MKVAFYVPHIPDENTTPPLGPLSLIAVLERAGFDGRLFDARIDAQALDKLLAFAPDVLGVSAVTPGYLGGLRAAALVKERLPGVHVLFGGPHPTALPSSVAAEAVVDVVVSGESERQIVALCQALRDDRAGPDALRRIDGLTFVTPDGDTVQTPPPAPIPAADLDALPWPAFHRMDLDTYFSGTQAHGLFRRGTRILPIMSTRGCPHPCTFCCRVMGKRIRARSADSVMAEIRHLIKRYDIDEVYFEDDNFTIQRDRALTILERMAALDPPVYLKFANGIRADAVDRELLEAMRRARVYSLSFGLESGCRATLEKMRKRLDLQRARENVLLAKELGFLVGANCIIGYPGETVPDVRESLAFFLKLPLDSMAIVNLVPFPGTEARRVCEENGYLTRAAANWDNYYFAINNPIPLIETPDLPADVLVRLIHEAYRRMYMRPRWLLRTLRHLTPAQIWHGVRMMFGFGPGR